MCIYTPIDPSSPISISEVSAFARLFSITDQICSFCAKLLAELSLQNYKELAVIVLGARARQHKHCWSYSTMHSQ